MIPIDQLSGEEHRVRLDKATRTVLKCTHPETYGGAPAISYDLDPVTQRPEDRLTMGKATPMQYLARWSLFNAVFGDEVRLERVLEVDYGLSIVISQRDITGEAPEVEEIEHYFHERGFVPVPRSRDAYYRRADDVLALDAHQANLVRTADGLVPIDIPVFRGAGDRDIARWLRKTMG